MAVEATAWCNVVKHIHHKAYILKINGLTKSVTPTIEPRENQTPLTLTKSLCKTIQFQTDRTKMVPESSKSTITRDRFAHSHTP